MSIRRLPISFRVGILFTLLWSFSASLHAQSFEPTANPSHWGGSDEDTILVEYTQDSKISYSRTIKAACKSLLGFDIDAFFSGGKNKRSAVIRQFDDLSERTHYRLRLDQEEVAFKFTLNL